MHLTSPKVLYYYCINSLILNLKNTKPIPCDGKCGLAKRLAQFLLLSQFITCQRNDDKRRRLCGDAGLGTFSV